jgi:pimeloyl-ACP methyl ester carboxylesterase
MLNGKNKIVQANGINICYDDFGKGHLPILFIHGFPFDKSMWQPQLDFFISIQRVIAYDIRGFGKSTAGAEEISISLFADDLIGLMDVLQIDKAVVCGLSMGGYILLNAISRYPERFEAIILSDTQCIADSTEVKVKRNKTIQQLETGGLKDFADVFVKNIFCQDSLSDKIIQVEEIKKVILSTDTLTLTRTLNAIAQRREMCSSLKEIKVPSLILCGKEDTITPPEQAQFLQCNIANSRLYSIEKAGHMSNLEQASEFNQHLANFISDLEN